ncbi:MAG TPA: acyltransferase [Candidatus Dormibacteraeota bacterium]|jgi:peptidoglycan/LPS O-acetylase OafA/YrhL|nr:acyltransferase [Candidatus Dormibacteraeota bacterium]
MPPTPTTTERPATRRSHLWQIDLLRIVPMVMVVATHTVMFTYKTPTIGSNAALFVLHVSRFLFFFITAFVLFYQYGDGRVSRARFWRKRYPPIVVPYVAWTLIYWLLNPLFPWSGQTQLVPGALKVLGLNLAQGWFHLYFLVVTMQFYLVFPFFAWLIRRTRRWHLQLLAVATVLELVWTGVMTYGWRLMPHFEQVISSHAQVELTSYEFFFLVGALAAVHRERLMGWVRARRTLAIATSAGAVLVSLSVYVLNLQFIKGAATVFQPATLLLFLGATLGLWIVADTLLNRYGADGRVWRVVHTAAGLSFGIYLSHLVSLQFLLLAQADGLAGLNLLSGPLWTATLWVLTVAGSTLISWTLGRTPLSWVLTGRSRTPLRRPAPDSPGGVTVAA